MRISYIKFTQPVYEPELQEVFALLGPNIGRNRIYGCILSIISRALVWFVFEIIVQQLLKFPKKLCLREITEVASTCNWAAVLRS